MFYYNLKAQYRSGPGNDKFRTGNANDKNSSYVEQPTH